MRRRLLIGLALLVLILAALPFALDREHVSLDDELRSELEQQGHTFARLENTVVHYELSGEADAPLVVFIHGVSGPMEVWDSSVRAVEEADFRTLRFDHLGRGWSDRVPADYDLDLFVTTLEQLLDEVAPEAQPIFLVGSSMGAIVATEFTIRHPGRVAKVALLGPAGFPIEAGFLARFIKVPVVGDYLMKVFGDRSLTDHNRRYFVDPTGFESFQRRFEEQLAVRGSKAAVLSTMRYTPVQSYLARYRQLGRIDVPVLIAWGRGDTVFPYAHHEEALEAIPQAEFVAVEDAGHLPMLERPGPVMTRLIPFLMQGTAAGHLGH